MSFGAMTNYAIIKSGGKQYRVKSSDLVDVERLPDPEGARVELKDVLLVSQDGQVTVGQPTVPGARVIAEVKAHLKDRKVVVFKYKAKTRYRRKRGHRQPFTRLEIKDIVVGGAQ